MARVQTGKPCIKARGIMLSLAAVTLSEGIACTNQNVIKQLVNLPILHLSKSNHLLS